MYRNLIILFIVFITGIYIIKYNYFENFEINDENIYSEKNLFINSEKKYNLDNISINKLCIQDPESNKVVCITKEELFNALKLPSFRRHAVCIDDACITNNNVNKLIGKENINLESKNNLDSDGNPQCVGLTSMDVSGAKRIKLGWEEGKNYYGPNIPEGGWKKRCYECKSGRKFCRKKKWKSGSDKKYNYRYIGMSGNPIYNKYGCTRNHLMTRQFCWASAGGRCYRAKKLKKGWIKAVRKKKIYEIEGSPINGVETLQNDVCPNKDEDSNVNFTMLPGKMINDFDLLNKPFKNANYLIDRHDEHTKIN